jgi:hypothetical protein
MGPSVYIIFGLVLIFASKLILRPTIEHAPRVVENDVRDGGELRIQSRKVVPINRNRVSRRAVLPKRVGNYY